MSPKKKTRGRPAARRNKLPRTARRAIAGTVEARDDSRDGLVKIICAKTIVQAVIAAQEQMSEADDYDPHWPLSVAVQLLEEAHRQLDQPGGGTL
jgi:hypothetical protein